MFLRTLQMIYLDIRALRDKAKCLDVRNGTPSEEFRNEVLCKLSYLIIALILLGGPWWPPSRCSCVCFTAVVGFSFYTDRLLLVLAQTLFRTMDNFALVVVLYFILCGNIMTAGTIVDKLIKAANAMVSWLPGGLGMAGIIACGMFGAISASRGDVVAWGLYDPGPDQRRL